jgi:hypothetical protein
MIEVKRTREGDPLEFEVIVRVGGSETRHHVTMARDTCERLTAGRHTPERCIEAAFQFLLDREPKESILRHFDVTVISHYFLSSSARCRATSRNLDSAVHIGGGLQGDIGKDLGFIVPPWMTRQTLLKSSFGRRLHKGLASLPGLRLGGS